MAELPRQSNDERDALIKRVRLGAEANDGPTAHLLRDVVHYLSREAWADRERRADEVMDFLGAEPVEEPAAPASYYVEIVGDDGRMVAGDIVDLIHGHYNVKAAIAPPVEVKLTILGPFGETKAYAVTWEPMSDLVVQTGATRIDLDAVSAKVEMRPLR